MDVLAATMQVSQKSVSTNRYTVPGHTGAIQNRAPVALLEPLHDQPAGTATLLDADHRRRACVQQNLYSAMAFYDHPKLMWRKGCNYNPILDFESWARSLECGGGGGNGGVSNQYSVHADSDAAAGPLLVHTAWEGPW